MLDTNTVSYILKGLSQSARTRLANLEQDEAACVSCITEAELWYGLARVGGGERRRHSLRAFLARLQVLPWGREEALTYGSFRAKQEAKDRSLGPLDTQIAAHAIAIGAVLISNNAAFQHAIGLPGLDNWAIDL
jgi:tRNA(fMet)-specific endonuclease VapC